jgi:hypothetical protein
MMHQELYQSYGMGRDISIFYHFTKATKLFGVLIWLAHVLQNESTACLIVAELAIQIDERVEKRLHEFEGSI